MSFKINIIRGVVTLIISAVISIYQVTAQSDLVKIKFTQTNLEVNSNSEFSVTLNVDIAESWHVNSDKPNEDYLIPSEVVSKYKPIALKKIDYPDPEELKFGFSDIPVSVFGGDINIKLTFYVGKSAERGKHIIPVEFSYQACNDRTCLAPTSVGGDLIVEVSGSGLQTNPTSVETSYHDKRQEISIKDAGENVPGLGPQVEEELSSPGGSGIGGNSIASTFESSSILLSLLFVFLGGLALNLTPCVYPLVPITIGYFGGQSEGRTGRLFILGILYVLGMAITYSLIGVVTSLSGAVFGGLLQNPFVIMGIAFLFIVLALSQFGVYEFRLPHSWTAKAGGSRNGLFGAFFMGLTMGIVAAPCIGPFVLGLVTYVAAKGDPLYGFTMFFVLALGLGLPYLFLALFSGKIKSLPRAGAWMEGVKHIFGFLLLALAIYFLAPLLPKALNRYLLPVYGLAAALYILLFDKATKNVKGFQLFRIILSVAVISVSVYALIPVKDNSPNWQTFSAAVYEQSLKNREIMIIDFYADWCIPCKELDAMTFSDSRVLEMSREFTWYKADMTKNLSEEYELLRKQFNVAGFPTVLVIDKEGREVERITGFVNADHFLNILSKMVK